MNVPFVKMSGSGNDFIIIDDRDGQLDELDKSALAVYLCRRQVSIGADGLIFMERSQRADFRMNYFNSDGSSAAMCGNGARCAAYSNSMINGKSEIKIETDAGIVIAKILSVQGSVEIQMPGAELLLPNIELVIDGLPMRFDLYNTGVPHAVTFVDDIESVPVKHWGREIRYHRRFMPDGANADFVEVIDDETLRIRTYERGVEDETLACGTGAIAAALSAHRKKLVKMPVNVLTELPDKLTINLNEQQTFDAIKPTLAGKVIFSFSGEVNIPSDMFIKGKNK